MDEKYEDIHLIQLKLCVEGTGDRTDSSCPREEGTAEPEDRKYM